MPTHAQSRHTGLLLLALSLPFTFLSCMQHGNDFPPTEKKPVTEYYGDISFVDNYRWLDNLQDPPVRKWNDAQNAYSRKYFDGVSCLPAVQARLKELTENAVSTYYDFWYRTRLFALKEEPPKNQPMIVTFSSVIDTAGETVVVDPNAIDPSGTTSIDWFRPSRDGKLVAVSLSKNGSEDGTLYIFDVSTGKALGDTIPRVQFPTASGSAEWNADNSGLYYTRYPQGSERPKEDVNFYQQVYYHKLGTPVSSDAYAIGKEFPRIAECTDLIHARREKHPCLGGERRRRRIRALPPKGSGPWQQITQFSDKVVDAHFGTDGRSLSSLSCRRAERKDPRDAAYSLRTSATPASLFRNAL